MDIDVLKVSDLSGILQCSRNRAYELVKTPTFPKIKIGRRYYIPKDELGLWLKTYTYKEYKI